MKTLYQDKNNDGTEGNKQFPANMTVNLRNEKIVITEDLKPENINLWVILY